MRIIITLRFALALLLLIALPHAEASQRKMAMEECIYSFEDSNFNPWNETSQSGVFYTVKNLNPDPMGGTSSQYRYNITHQPHHRYFNTTTVTSTYSSIPILQILPGRDNIVYINCTYNISENFMLQFVESMCGDGCGSSQQLLLTYDFNLSKGIMVNEKVSAIFNPAYLGFPAGQGLWYAQYAASYLHDPPEKINFINSNFSVFEPLEHLSYAGGKQQSSPTDVIYYVITGYGLGASPLEFGDKSKAKIYLSNPDLQIAEVENPFINNRMTSKGKTTILSAANLSKLGSGLLMLKNGHFENGDFLLTGADSWDMIWYINTTNDILYKMLLPAVVDIKITNLDTLEKKSGCHVWYPDQCIDINWGDSVMVNMTLHNQFNVVLDNITAAMSISTSEPSGLRYGKGPYLGVSYYTNRSELPMFSLKPGENRSLVGTAYIAPDTLTIKIDGYTELGRGPNLTAAWNKQFEWPLYGGTRTEQPILYLGGLSVGTSLVSGSPQIDLALSVFTQSSLFFSDLPLPESSYELIVKVFKVNISGAKNEFKNYTISLNQTVYNMQWEGNPINNNNKLLRISIPLTADYFSAPGTKYFLDVFGIKKTVPFMNLITTALNGNPQFSPGETQYAENKDFSISQSGMDHRLIYLFNPDWEAQVITLNLSGFTFPETGAPNRPDRIVVRITDNQTGSSKEATFFDIPVISKVQDLQQIASNNITQRYSHETSLSFNLNALDTKNISVRVIAQYYSAWPNDDVSGGTFTLTSSTTQAGKAPTSIIYNYKIEKFVPNICNELSTLSGCLTKSSCTWNKTRFGGECLDCGLFKDYYYNILHCAAYNNNESCMKDNCKMPLSPIGSCTWNILINSCVEKQGNCYYDITTTCNEFQPTGDVRYNAVAPSSSCENYSFQTLCSGYVELPFFTVSNLIIVLLSIIGISGIIIGLAQTKALKNPSSSKD